MGSPPAKVRQQKRHANNSSSNLRFDPFTGIVPLAAGGAEGGPVSCGAPCGGNTQEANSGGTGGTGAACCSRGDASGTWPVGGPSGGSVGGVGDSGAGFGVDPGMAVWEVSEPYISLWLYDEPLGYQPGIGPRITFGLAYKQRGTPDISPNIFSLGTNWTCAWLSYVEDDGSGTNATLMLKRGGRVYFIPPDGSTMEYYTHTTLERQTNIYGGLTGFIRSYASGAKDYYQYIPPHGIVLPDGNTPVFLSVRTDPLGRTNIVFAYDAPIVGSVRVLRLASVKD